MSNSIEELAQQIKELKAIVEKQRQDISILKTLRHQRPGMALFCLESSRTFGELVAGQLGIELETHREKYHPDGEIYIRPTVNVRRKSCFVIQSLYSDEKESVNDKFTKLEIMVHALRDASAEEITVICPKFGYDRSDRKCKSREPVITKMIAQQLESLSVDRIITMDVHNLAAYQNAFRSCRADHLECRFVVCDYLARELSGYKPTDISILSTDIGGVHRCEDAQKSLSSRIGEGIGIAVVSKKRAEDKVTGDRIIGDVRPCMIIWDDVIATAGTMNLAMRLAHDNGAKAIYIVSPHGLFVGDANKNLDYEYLTRLILTDSIPPFRLNQKNLQKTVTVSVAPLFAEAIRRSYSGESLSSLFN